MKFSKMKVLLFGNVEELLVMHIRKLVSKDYYGWLRLYMAYAKHYHVTLSDESLSITWGWLMDTAHPTEGVVAENNEELVGLAQYRAMPSPLRGHNIGFVDDLIVLPSFRGQRISEKLFEDIQLTGKRLGWKTIRWITRDNNYHARKVYDRIALKTDWNLYEMDCD